jgi:hypothetical protein
MSGALTMFELTTLATVSQGSWRRRNRVLEDVAVERA